MVAHLTADPDVEGSNLAMAWVRLVNEGNLLRRNGTEWYVISVFMRQDGF